MLDIVNNLCCKVFNISKDEIEIVDQLKLGMSNLVYLVKIGNEKYTVRIPGIYSEVFVDRNTEKLSLAIVEPYNLAGKTIYFDEEKGYKISKYIDGRVLYQNIKNGDYKKVAKTLHKLHEIKSDYITPYNPLVTLEYYESLGSFKSSEDYFKIKNKILKYKDLIDRQKKTLCHNDSQPSNFIFGNDGNMYLIDYEFTGLNDPIYDIACFGNNNILNGLNLLKEYFGREPSDEEYTLYYIWRTFQNLQWYQVAMYKDELGLGKQLGLDFKEIANMFLANAKKSISNID